MADKRTVVAIPADTWTEIINGAKTANIKEGISNVSYYSMLFSTDPEIPADVDPADAPTSEKMFEKDSTEILNDAALTYVWVRCSPGEVGSVIVT
ncbi:MAG: hypothetical protein GWP06_00255 [Actinobacteria bacterium]|nr:hypothetical protein [Actinomycetota bacterium]